MAGFAGLVAVSQELALLIGILALVVAVAWEYREMRRLSARRYRPVC